MAKQGKGAGTHLDVAVDEMADAEQLRIDLEDARARLGQLADAIEKKKAADLEVLRLQQQLKAARQRAKVAGWDVGIMMERAKKGCR